VDRRRLVAPRQRCGGRGRTPEAILAREAAQRWSAYAIDAVTGEGVRPAHIKERIRALGPTVRLDLSSSPPTPPPATG
jgi:hypothetical protein